MLQCLRLCKLIIYGVYDIWWKLIISTSWHGFKLTYFWIHL